MSGIAADRRQVDLAAEAMAAGHARTGGNHEHLGYYLDSSYSRLTGAARSEGNLFYRLVQQAAALDPTSYRSIVADRSAKTPGTQPQDIGAD